MAGAFTTDELLAWLSGVKPTVKKDILHVPQPGAVAYNMRLREEAAVEQREKQARILEGEDGEEEEDDDDDDPDAPYEPHYNLNPDDEEAFNFVDDYDPGNPTNPRAQPGDHDYAVDQSTEIYGEFSFDNDSNPQLPIHEFKEEILSTINAGQVTVIQGSTGSGKSTQVPQFILEQHAAAKRHCNIICTQPRRIAAKSVARFVASTRGWDLGSLVGYQIGMDRNISEKTRLTFVTTGVLLEKLVNQRNMNQYTHVILDEVHERDKDTDFCLLVVRKLLHTNSPHVKVILMSATFETAYFASYFSTRLSGSNIVPPVIKVEGTPYPVHEFYLDNISHVGECEPMDLDFPRINTSCLKLVENLITDFDRIEQADPRYGRGDFVRGTVLVFLPGLPEIMQFKDMLGDNHLTKLLLHSSISWDDQYKVFLPPEPGKRKVILATNIAESSITVPDIKYVIDFCLVKQMMCDWTTKYCCLQTVWASRASLSQRKGRAGRVSSGRCYRLISSDFYHTHIPEYSIPEMQRCPIENIVLKCKKLNMGEPRQTLRLALQPPKPEDIEVAITTLKEVGGLTITVNGVVNKFDGDMTFVGKILERLPIDVKLGKLLILGHSFGCLESCLVIAAALSVKSFFTRSPLDELTAYRAKRSWDESSSSDCLAILYAYKAWVDMKKKHRFSQARNSELQWCKRNFLNKRILQEVSELVAELTKRLSFFNIKPSQSLNPSHDVDPVMDAIFLKVVLSGACYPNYFLWGELDEELCSKEMSGHDPTTTVKVHGLPGAPHNYAEQLCSLMDVCGPGNKIHFESQKAFIEFKRPTASRSLPLLNAHPVLDSVYHALWLRNKRNKMCLYPIQEPSKIPRMSSAPPANTDVLPPLNLPDCGTHQIRIACVIDAGHFWAQFSDLKNKNKLRAVMKNISSRPLNPLILDPSKMVGTYCLARFSVDGDFYRAKILETTKFTAEVLYIDYGNTETLPFDRLCKMAQVDMSEPPLAFECYLSGIKPAPPFVRWTDNASLLLDQYTCKDLIAEVYSLVEGALRVELYDTNNPRDVLINQFLINEGHAVKCGEPYQSRVSNAQAKTRHSSEAATSSLLRSAFNFGSNRAEGYIPGVNGQSDQKLNISCTTVNWCSRYEKPQSDGHRIPLKGPASPFEVTFQSMGSSGHVHAVRVQRDSVNSVVINNEPEDKSQRMMVASHVLLNPTGSACVARDTTLLPSIPGFAHFMCLLFAPSVEMRCDELKRQYTGALCGLGYDPVTKNSLFPEHDMEITFDTLFTQDDLSQINCIRTAINMTMDSEDGVAEWGELSARKIQKNIRNAITRFVQTPRTSVPPYTCGKYGWCQVSHDDVIRVEVPEGTIQKKSEDDAPVYPMINGIDISKERIDLQRPTKILLMRKAVKELQQKVFSGRVEPGRVECTMCHVICPSGLEMRNHLRSEHHMVKERNLFSDDLEKDVVGKI